MYEKKYFLSVTIVTALLKERLLWKKAAPFRRGGCEADGEVVWFNNREIYMQRNSVK